MHVCMLPYSSALYQGGIKTVTISRILKAAIRCPYSKKSNHDNFIIAQSLFKKTPDVKNIFLKVFKRLKLRFV